jgi:hypothetical protein
MTDLRAAVGNAITYLIDRGDEIPADVWAKTIRAGVFKADGSDIGAINATYHDAITRALLTYLEGGAVTSPRNQFKRATIEAFGGAWDMGWDGDPPTGDALEWFNARVEQELSYIDTVFAQAKELRKEDDFDALAWASQRADSYTQTISSIFNAAKMWAAKNKMLTWHLGNTEKHCDTCAKLDGQSHRASWFVSRDYIPRKPGAAMLCGGYYCDCRLTDKDGNEITI